MATNIFNYDGTLLTTVADGALDESHASIKFPGRGYQNYGEPVLENILWVMQNFAGTTAPPNPSEGQLWYDNTAGASILKIWDGIQWGIAGGVIASATPPSQGSNEGAFWYDTVNKQLNTWSGTTWDLVGPLGSKVNSDPVNPAIPDHSIIDSVKIIAVEDGQAHQIWRVTVGGKLLIILSKDPVFTPQSSNLINGGFSKIYPGINFNSSISGISIAGDNTIFKSTQTNTPSIDVNWDLGSPSKRFNTFYSASGVFSNGIGINTVPTQFNFEVNGTSKFDNTVIFGPGATTHAPTKWTAGPLLATPQSGAVEFDGNDFYFTGILNGVPVRQTPIFNSVTGNSSTYYVSTHGNDANDGKSRTTAFATIKKAVSVATAGYSIFIESGEYYEQNPIRVPPKVSIVGDNLRRVIVRPVHNQLDIFHVDVNSYFFGMTFKDHRAPAFCFAFPCSLATAVVVNGTVTKIIPNWSDSGYVSPPEVYIEAPPFGNGGNTQAIATANLVNGAIVDVIINVNGGGSGYLYPPIISFTGSGNTGSGATATGRINSNGQLVAIDITSPGSGYVAPVSVAISGGGGSNASASAIVADGVIGSYTIAAGKGGSGYTRAPWVSVRSANPPIITSSPYVQNCSSITGPFDINGQLITGLTLPYDITAPGGGYAAVDTNGAGAGIRIDGEVCHPNTVIRSFVADAFTQLNQGGIGHLILNRGYAQFVSCFTTFSSIGYWARSGGFANISNSVIDFGDIGLQAEGYYPGPLVNGRYEGYSPGLVDRTYTSSLGYITVTNGGSGYTENFTMAFPEGLGNVGGTAGYGTVIVNPTSGQVVGVQLINTGNGYVSSTSGPINLVDPTNVAPGTGALGLISLESPASIQVDDTSQKPESGSGMLLNGKFYKVVSAYPGSIPGSWLVTTIPPVISTNQGAEVFFYEISNISTGGLALEYVGSGTTYNSLPFYGGIPDVTKQVVDGEDPGSLLYPGRVYYVTIDNTGNFKIGPFFSVSFIDGTITFGADSKINLTNLISIGPFERNGAVVGTYANEISYQTPSLTHLSDPTLDSHTIPTQADVRGYFLQVNSDILPYADNAYNLGILGQKWKKLNAYSVVTGNISATNSVVSTEQVDVLTNTTLITTPNLIVNGNSTINTAIITNAFITTANVSVINTPLILSNVVETASLLSGTGHFSNTLDVTGNASFTSNVTVNGNILGSSIATAGTATLGTTTITGRILGDFTTTTPFSNRLMFQTTTANSLTGVPIIPNGTANIAFVEVNNDGTGGNNGSMGQLLVTGSDVRLVSGARGTGAEIPLTFYTNGLERARIDTSGNVGINTTSTLYTLHVNGSTYIDGTLTLGNPLTVPSGGTGVTSLSGVVYGNGTGAFTAATGTQISTAIGATYVQNANHATSADSASGISGGSSSATFAGLTVTGTVTFNNPLTVPNGGTGVTSLTGVVYGNGSGAFTSASASQIVSAIGSTAVANATNASYATTAGSATSATSATNATYATTAGSATSATSASYATTAGSASSCVTFSSTTMNIQCTSLTATGDITALTGSDQRLKINITPISDALTKVISLDGVTFNWTEEAKKVPTRSDKTEAGVIAQQVEAVLPEVVVTREDGYKAVDYPRLIPLLIQAIKELNEKVEKLEKGQ